MTRAKVLALLALSACLHDHYTCETDSDCDLGVAGRCEADHHCTQLDMTCPTERAYTPHSGAESGMCFAGQIALANPCAPDQPAAEPSGCAASVCAKLPACCSTMWTEACVLEAQRTCGIACDTRLAITATRGARTDQWLASTRDGTTWQVTARGSADVLAYVAPTPGGTAPRLASIENGMLALDDQPLLAVGSDRTYEDITSTDAERSLRDTLSLASIDSSFGQHEQLVDVATGRIRNLGGPALRQVWGDYDHDAFPDLVAVAGSHYDMLKNDETSSHVRTFAQVFDSTVTGFSTASSPAIRALTWGDLQGDHELDLVVFGDSIRIHKGAPTGVPDIAITFDCDPPTNPPGVCGAGSGSNDTGSAAFSGAVLPEGSGAALVTATFPTRGLYRIRNATGTSEVTPLSLDGSVSPNSAIIAVVVRDLDGDHALDVLAIDQQLDFYVALSKTDPTLTRFVEVSPFGGSLVPPANGFSSVRVSASGALIP